MLHSFYSGSTTTTPTTPTMEPKKTNTHEILGVYPE